MLSVSRTNIILCALCFCILFSAYNTLQNYATTLFPGNLGQISLGILYATAGVTVFAGPPLTNVYGSRVVMIAGAACYVAYLLSLIWLSPPLVMVMSVIIGFGAAILWIALGVFITENSTPKTYATNTGLWWSIFQVNNIIGNLVTYFVIANLTSSSVALYIGFAVVAGVGTLGLVFLRPPPTGTSAVGDLGGNSGKPLLEQLKKAGRDALRAALLIANPDMLLLLPIFFFSGGELAFWTGEFPLLLSNQAYIGLVLSLAGVGEVLGGYSFGRLSDTVGRSASVILALGFYAGALVLTCLMKTGGAHVTAGPTLSGNPGPPYISFVAALFFGLADSGLNANAYAMCSQLRFGKEEGQGAVEVGREDQVGLLDEAYGIEQDNEMPGSVTGEEVSTIPHNPRSSVGAFTVFQLVQNAGSALWYLVSLQLPVHDAPGAPGSFSQIWIQVGFLVIVGVTFVVLDARTRDGVGAR